jgi:hypothetical protein
MLNKWHGVPKEKKMTTQSYADTQNALFNQTGSSFVTLQQRLVDALELKPLFKNMLDGAVDEFRRRNKMWKAFSDISLCTAIPVSMDNILIDTTLQRPLNVRHIIKILSYFRQTMVMPIQVYEDPTRPGYYIAWDGQHTVISLYIIATKVFGMHPKDINIPVVVYPTHEKLEIRRNFILLNGDAKEPLDFIDTYKQMVYGVRVDKAQDTDWLQADQKQTYLENAGLFATNSKFGDEGENGAFTLLADTIMTKNLSKAKDPKVTKLFSDYWSYLNVERPVQAKEARQLFEYFNLCLEQKIKVDNNYIREFVNFTKEYFEADFSETGRFWDKVKLAYTNWYAKANPDSYEEFGLKGFTTEMRTGIPFLIAQLKKSTNLKTPKYIPNNGFTVSNEDLWS